jgi:hypothetical protein
LNAAAAPAIDHDQIIVLALEAGRGKVRGTGAQQLAIDLVALEVHRRAVIAFGAYLDGWRLGEANNSPTGHIDLFRDFILERDIIWKCDVASSGPLPEY